MRSDLGRVGFRRGLAQKAELVALGVGEHDPGHLAALSDVGRPGPDREQPCELGLLVGAVRWPNVEMQPVLHRLGLWDAQKEQVGRRSVRGRNTYLVVGGVRLMILDDLPTDCLLYT